MGVCISYTHPYPIKSLNHTLSFRKCNSYFGANMQVASTFWPDIKSQKLLEHRFRLIWTKSDARTQFRQAKTGQDQRGPDKEAQDSLLEEYGVFICWGEAWVLTGNGSCSSFELGNDKWLWPLVSEPSMRGSWVACHWKSELLAALLPCSTTMTYDSVSCLCSTASHGLLAFECLLAFRCANLSCKYFSYPLG